MNLKKTALLVLGSNLLWLGVLAAVVAFTQPAQASAPASTQAGPYYLTLGAMDFQAYEDINYAFARSGIGLYKAGSNDPMIAITGVQFPPNATITEMLLDAEDLTSGGDIQLILWSCPIGGSCTSRATIVTNDAARSNKSTALSYAVNNGSEGYFLQANYRGGGGAPDGDLGLFFVRIAYTLPAPAFLPVIAR